MGLGGGWVDGWVHESDGLMEGWMDTFVLEWMSGGGTNGWMCAYMVGRGGKRTVAGWMEGWTTPVCKQLGGPCSCVKASSPPSLLPGGLLTAPVAGSLERTRAFVWCLGAEVTVWGDTAPARPSRTLRAGSVGTFSLWSFSRVSPHPACTLSSHGRGVPALWGAVRGRPVRLLPVGPHPCVLCEVSEAPEPSGTVEN